MTVRELIEQLEVHDPERLVMVQGYEGGFCTPAAVSIVENVELWQNKDASYMGAHDLAFDGIGFTVLVIYRQSAEHEAKNG